MSVYKKRISAMQALIAGTVVATNNATFVTIKEEFEEVKKADQVKPLNRRRLLQVLHSTRALDSFLKNLTDNFGIRGQSNSLGGYLSCLENHNSHHLNRLSNGRSHHYKRKIADKRNLYMHEAGAFPANEPEVLTLISDMQSCIAEISQL